jgi:hypothetical protein
MLVAAALPAQEPVPPVAARVSGVVFDSLAMRPLAGAIVQLVSPAEASRARSIQTDATGAFAFDSLGAGRYLLGFYHALLDSLGLAMPLSVLDVRTSGELRVPLATPSARTMVTNLCGARAAADSTGVLVGFVRSARHGMGLAGATVAVSWAELSVSADGIRRFTPTVRGTASDAGGIALCGVPVGAQVLARAWVRQDSSGFAELVVPDHGLLWRDLYVGESEVVAVADSTADSALVSATSVLRGSGTLRGVVRRPDGSALPGARLVFWGAGSVATSGSTGAYRMTELPSGTYTVEARALGFLPQRKVVDILEGSEAVADLTLESFGTFLDTVKVTTQRLFTSTRMQEFEQRKKSGLGYFMDENEINKRSPIFMSDLFRMAPGMVIAPGRGASNRVLMRGMGFSAYCQPTIYLDGMRVSNIDGDLEAIVNVQDVKAVEVYTRASNIPVQFQSLEGCGSLVIWTGGRRAPQ